MSALQYQLSSSRILRHVLNMGYDDPLSLYHKVQNESPDYYFMHYIDCSEWNGNFVQFMQDIEALEECDY